MKIYTPPIITAKCQINYGHGVNLVFCDVFGRIDGFVGRSTELSLPCWNNHGLRSEKIAESKLSIERDITQKEAELNEQLKYFGLKDYTYYRDNSESSKKLSQNAFECLLNQGFIKKDGQIGYVLMVPEIIKRTGLLSHLEGINVWPKKAGIEEKLNDLILKINGEYPMSKNRYFATQIPCEPDPSCKINPVFDLAISPLLLSDRSVDYAIDGSRTFLHGTFLPYLIWAAFNNKPFSRNIYIHGYSKLSSDLKELSLRQLTEEFGSDVLRFTLLTQAGRIDDKTHDRGLFKKGRIVRSKLLNIARFFYTRNINVDMTSLPLNELNRYESENISTLMEEICSEAIELSSELSKNSSPKDLVDRYKSFTTLVSPVMPLGIAEVKNTFLGYAV